MTTELASLPNGPPGLYQLATIGFVIDVSHGQGTVPQRLIDDGHHRHRWRQAPSGDLARLRHLETPTLFERQTTTDDDGDGIHGVKPGGYNRLVFSQVMPVMPAMPLIQGATLGPGAVVLVVVLGAAPVVPAQTADMEQGKRLYESLCGSCHGPQGNGGRGANLAQPRLRRATDDQALVSIIRRGIRGTEMPGSPLTPSQVSSIAAYVKTLGRVAPEDLPGDGRRGETVYASLDCERCHTLAGRGGIVGPELDDIGARRSAAHLREALIDPEASVPRGFLQLRVVTADGRALTGVRVNEDGFSIQFRDLSGRLYSFWKTELDTLEHQWQRSPMQGYAGRLTTAQTDDLVAYLVSLKGAR